MSHALNVNGATVRLDAPLTTLLVDVIRTHCNLSGTNQGCDTAQCGACTVLLDGHAVKSCNVMLGQLVRFNDLSAAPVSITTIEGVSQVQGDTRTVHELQILFSKHHALQCGYCTPGMIMRALAMRAEGVPADAPSVRHALAGNLCRCTGYEGIVTAIVEWLADAR